MSTSEHKPALSVVMLGHVDTGKSTILGHLLYQSGCIQQRHMDKLRQEAEDLGKPSFAFAWVSDKTKSERERGVTIDVHDHLLITSKYSITMIDTPGHRDFTKNTIAGASFADCALLVVSSPPGEFEASMLDISQTREHALIAFALGIKQLVVVVNKMDAGENRYQQARYTEVCTEVGAYLKTLGYQDDLVQYVPVSGWTGENLLAKSANMPWYTGPALLEMLDEFKPPRRCTDRPVRFPVQASYRIGGIGTVVVGRLETGVLKPGMQLTVGPTGEKCTVFSMEMHHRSLSEAEPGACLGINLKGIPHSAIKRGFVLSDARLDPARSTRKFEAQIVLLDHPGRLMKGSSLVVHCHSLQVSCSIDEIKSKLDRETGAVLESQPGFMEGGAAYVVEMTPSKRAVFEAFREYPTLGRLVLRDSSRTVGVGIVRSVTKREPLLPVE